jgi:hypothetical protein
MGEPGILDEDMVLKNGRGPAGAGLVFYVDERGRALRRCSEPVMDCQKTNAMWNVREGGCLIETRA